jgi:23S rRNA (cytosine1962-C5)-methyltransferase
MRLFHGDAEGIPGLAVDRYADVAVIHSDSSTLLEGWLPELHQELESFGSAYAKVHPRGVSHLQAEARQRLAPEEPVWGRRVEAVTVEELGVRYQVRPGAGLSVGLFLDMREIRRWLRQVCDGREVLNLFAYTCSLGVCAVLGGARRVVNLDLSRPYLEWGKANYQLNACAAEARDFIYGEAFDWLHRFARRGERFDLVIVDPPSFSSTPFSVRRDYPRLVQAAARVTSPGGMLLAATNHVATSSARFEAWLQQGLAAADRRGEIVQRWHEPEEDFPHAAGLRPYLKARAVKVE